MKILAVSDVVVNWLYSPRIRLQLSDIDLAIGCGDLPSYYLEYIISSLNIPSFQVNGNHSIPIDILSDHNHTGSINLHCRVRSYKEFTFAGIEGSLRYNNGVYQYSQLGMWLNVFKLVPSMLLNHVKYGRFLNIFVSHAPPWGIHDQPDLAHQGIKAFRWLLSQFQPDYHLHGHIHVYRPDAVIKTEFGKTKVVNTFGYQIIEF